MTDDRETAEPLQAIVVPGVIAMALVLVALPLRATPAVRAADGAATELAKKTQYPVADLISVPFQHNFYFNSGPKDATV